MTSTKLTFLRSQLEQKKGKRDQLSQKVHSLRMGIKEKKREYRRHEQAHEIIKEVGLKTQAELSYHISDIASLALDAVFDEPYKLVAEFVERRDRAECDLLFERDGQRVNPIDASGVGAIDVAAFALRVASWTMQTPRTRNTIILDEPMKFLSRNLQERASEMIKEISQRLGIQFIIVTHEPTLASYADRRFEVKQKKGVSEVIQEDVI